MQNQKQRMAIMLTPEKEGLVRVSKCVTDAIVQLALP